MSRLVHIHVRLFLFFPSLLLFNLVTIKQFTVVRLTVIRAAEVHLFDFSNVATMINWIQLILVDSLNGSR